MHHSRQRSGRKAGFSIAIRLKKENRIAIVPEKSIPDEKIKIDP